MVLAPIALMAYPGFCSVQRGACVKRLLLVEDQPNDVRAAAGVAEALGIENVQACNSAHSALASLEKGLRGESPLPDGIVLDLDLGLESGYELLRFWHGSPALHHIPVIVWSVVEMQREVCELFKVNSFVSKWEGIGAFRDALGQLISTSTTDPSARSSTASAGSA